MVEEAPMRLKILSRLLLLLSVFWVGAEVERGARIPVKPKFQLIKVFVATRALPAGQVIPCRAVEAREIPKEEVPVGAITDFGKAAGCIAIELIAKGDVLQYHTMYPQIGGCISSLLPPGMRAVSVVTENTFRPKELVDVLLDEEVLRDVPVLAAGPGGAILMVSVPDAKMIDASATVQIMPGDAWR
jgi:Flp pilus assembly protein CpaB